MERKLFSFFLIFIVSMGVVSAGIEFGYDSEELPSVIISDIVDSVGGNVTSFLHLTDTPSSYTGSGGDCVKVNVGETALEFGSCGAGTGDNETWNESYANTLYAGIEWDYNQTTPAITYADGLVTTYNSTWSSTYNATYDASTGDNATWNESHADTLYWPLTSGSYNATYDGITPDDANWNKTYADTLYADISVTGDNASWNQSGASELFLELDGGNANSNIDIGLYNFSTTGTGFFQFLGSVSDYVSILRVFNIQFEDTINGSGNITTIGRITSPEFCTGSDCGNVSDFLEASDITNDTIDQRINASERTFSVLAGFTAGTYDGNITNGSLIGYVAANEICNIEIPGSHFCLKSEVLKTIANGNYTTGGTYWFQNGPPGFTANADDCVGWTSDDNTFLGPFWNWDVNGQAGAGRLTNCAQQKQLMCCL